MHESCQSLPRSAQPVAMPCCSIGGTLSRGWIQSQNVAAEGATVTLSGRSLLRAWGQVREEHCPGSAPFSPGSCPRCPVAWLVQVLWRQALWCVRQLPAPVRRLRAAPPVSSMRPVSCPRCVTNPALTLGEETAPGEASCRCGRATGVVAPLAPFCVHSLRTASRSSIASPASARPARPSPDTAAGSWACRGVGLRNA